MGRKTGINNGSADVRVRHMRYTQSQNELRRIAQADKAAALRMINALVYCKMQISLNLLRSNCPAWESWYDDDQNVPETATPREIARLINRRLSTLGVDHNVKRYVHRDIFIFDHSGDVFIFAKNGDCREIIPFGSLADAIAAIDALSPDNLGYGWALDYTPPGK